MPGFRDSQPSGEVDSLLEATYREGSDAPANRFTPYQIAPAQSFSGTLGSRGDRDWIAVEMEAGETYRAALGGSASGAGTLQDPLLRLYDSRGGQIAENDDNGISLESSLRYTAPRSGTYYLEAASFGDFYSGSYELSLEYGEPSPQGSLDDLADYLTDGYWQDHGASGRSFDTGSGNVVTVNLGGLTEAGRQLARWAFQAWESVADLEFVERQHSDADITFDDEELGAHSSSLTWGGAIQSSTVNVGTDWLDAYGTTVDSYSFQTYVHEIGHAIGLGHQGNYNGTASYGVNETFRNDSWQMSVMSYFDQWQNTSVDADRAGVATPMMADILAIQSIYGAADASSATAGRTTWGANSNLGGYLGTVQQALARGETVRGVYEGEPLAFTIFDRGGIDTLDLSFGTTHDRIDLRGAHFSDVGGWVGNLGIARGTVIERLLAGSGDDVIQGNGANNLIRSALGDDIVYGRLGDDRIEGGGGEDRLFGQVGHDHLFGGAQDDRIFGGNGFDVIRAGEGDDFVRGGLGRDHVMLGGGNDRYEDTDQGGRLGQDRALGRAGDDWLSGGGGDDFLSGQRGNDTLMGGSGDDRLLGGYGEDRLVGWTGRDQLSGQGGNDVLVGHGGADALSGGGGNDRLHGGLGQDRLWGGSGADRIGAGRGHDVVSGGNGRDTIFLGAGDDRFFDTPQSGPAGADRIRGGEGADRFHSGGGDDILTGGAGADRFVFSSPGFGSDRITDFERGTDTLRFDGSAFGFDGSITGMEVVDGFVTLGDEGLTFDFGDLGRLALDGLTSTAGLADDIGLYWSEVA